MLEKNNNNTPSVSGTSVSVFLPLRLPPSRGHPSQGHPSRLHPSRRHPSRGHPSQGHPSRPSSVSGTSVSATSVSGTSVSVASVLTFLRLGYIRLGGIRLGAIRLGGRPSSRLRRPRRMAQTDIPEMERHEDGGSIRLSFPSQEHPPVPFVSAVRLLQFNSSKYTLASVRVQFICLRLKTRY